MIGKSLLWKLTLAFLLVAVTTAALVAVFIRITSANRLTALITDQQLSALQSSLSDYYTQNGSWNDIAANWQQIRQQMLPTDFPQGQGSGRQGSGGHGGPPGDRRSFFGLADAQGKVVVPNDPKTPAGSNAPVEALKSGTPVTANGKKVGTILVPPAPPPFNREETLFLQRTNEALIFAVAGAMLVALIFGLLLARTLIRPLQALTEAAQKIAQGELEQQVAVGTNDEVGQLATAFNRMSQEVARGNELRRRMTADIAHDLRTPLTVIAGYIESMRDGVLQPTPERLTIIYTEIERLQNLVGDLKMLSQVDAGELPLHPEPIAPKCLLERIAAPFQHRAGQKGIALEVQAEEDLPEINVDEDRMMQVFGNLINNAIRYTPEGGRVTLKAELDGSAVSAQAVHASAVSASAAPAAAAAQAGSTAGAWLAAPTRSGTAPAKAAGQVLLTVEDNGEGIVAEELPFIFDRFHRADKSRHAESGESGLGLAIVKALVEAHGGSVSAESVYGQGTSIHISLPGAAGDGAAPCEP